MTTDQVGQNLILKVFENEYKPLIHLIDLRLTLSALLYFFSRIGGGPLKNGASGSSIDLVPLERLLNTITNCKKCKAVVYFYSRNRDSSPS